MGYALNLLLLYIENLPIVRTLLRFIFGVLAFLSYRIRSFFSSRSPRILFHEKDKVYLFQFPRSRKIPNVSPFCLKLETWLRVHDIPYEIVETTPLMHISREGTLPFVEFNGAEHPDSDLAIRDLSKKVRNATLEPELPPEEKAIARAFQILVEQSLWVGFLKFRDKHVKEVIALLPAYFGPFNFIYRCLAKYYVLYRNKQKTTQHDMGRHSDDDTIRLTKDDLSSLSTYLGSKPYLMGSKITKVDASVFGVLAQILYLPFETPQKKFILKDCQNLRDYVERIKEEYWPDWDYVTTQQSSDTKWKSFQKSNAKFY